MPHCQVQINQVNTEIPAWNDGGCGALNGCCLVHIVGSEASEQWLKAAHLPAQLISVHRSYHGANISPDQSPASMGRFYYNFITALGLPGSMFTIGETIGADLHDTISQISQRYRKSFFFTSSTCSRHISTVSAQHSTQKEVKETCKPSSLHLWLFISENHQRTTKGRVSN